jgi:phytoene/squalene synthetase
MNDWFTFSLLIFAGVVVFLLTLIYLRERRLINYCERIIKKNSLTFYKAFSKIENKKQRQAIYVVYAFCRYADDLIDEHQDIEGLNTLELELEAFKNHKKTSLKVFKALHIIKDRFYGDDYNYQPYFEMIQGQRMDITISSYETMDDVLAYCYYVASSVGLMLLPILAPSKHQELKEFAIQLGYAMQITNFLRDVGEDYLKGRIYIPQAALKKFQVDIDHEFKMGPTDSFKTLFNHLATQARQYYQYAYDHMEAFSQDVRTPLLYAAKLYEAILDECMTDYDVFTKKHFVSHAKKIDIIKGLQKNL